MVRIICQFCGANVNISEDELCPNCGASLADNEQLQQLRKMAAERNQINIDQAKLKNERMQKEVEAEQTRNRNNNRASKAIRIGCLMPFIIMVIGLIVSTFGVLFDIISDTSSDIIDSQEQTETQYVEPHHDAIFGEVVSTRYYDIVIDDWDYYTPNSYAISDGEKYIKLHFKYTNTSDTKTYDDNKIYCYEDNGRQCSTNFSISDELRAEKFDSQTVMPGKSYSGWIYYEVPDAATTLTVMYGDYVEIVIDITGKTAPEL